ncbi:MAG: tetratricopeptide repeat-containing sensor histidine kinase [Cyclobacteriaceae bacterium]|nr:tetratricopeptide repeat-containing sensor histidine kinase [Cyclobacteriaceae bacterium]
MMKGTVNLVLYFSLVLLPARAGSASPTLEDYKTRLTHAATSEDFKETFEEFVLLCRKGEFKLSEKDITEITLIARQKKYAEKVLPRVYSWAAIMFADGRMSEATTYFIESAKLYARQKKQVAEALCWFEVALIHHKAGNFQEAEANYIRALERGRDSLDHRTRINCYNGLALIDREQLEYDSALQGFRRAGNIAIQNKDTAWIAILQGNVGSIYLRTKKYDSSLYYYQENLRLIKKVDELENEIETYIQLARTYLGKELPLQTIKYLDTAEHIITSKVVVLNDFFNPKDHLYETYAKAYAALGDYQKAYTYYQEYHEVAEEKQQRINSSKLRQLTFADEFKQKENELALSHQINENNLLIIKQQRYAVAGSIVIILLLGALVFYAFRTSRQRKQLNKYLKQSNQELQRLNKLKDKLFSVISHDMRGPLANLQSILSLYASGNLNKEEFAVLSDRLNHRIKASGNALDSLLQWAMGELSEINATPSKVNVAELVNRVADQFEENMSVKQISLVTEVPDDLFIWVDKNQMEIVLRNLLNNAIKFSWDKGEISLVATRVDDRVHIILKDSGVGMNDEELSLLFDATTSFSTAGTHHERGTGIGLIISKEMVEKNGGEISVKSEKGSGSVFTVMLPAS